MIIYLHGFRSAPSSEKARLLGERMAQRGLADRYWCEQLPVAPHLAIERVDVAIRASRRTPLLVGSSLGGYYATYLAELHDLRAVLINPAVDAARCLAPNLGPQTNMYTGETFEFTRSHLAELEALAVPSIVRPERFWVLLESGDEVLDYRDAERYYAGARVSLIDGGDHSFRAFPRFIDEIIDLALDEADIVGRRS